MTSTVTTRLFAALANSERLAILDVLLDGPPTGPGASISEVARATEMTRFAASRHLAILRNSGLLSAERVRTGFRHRVNVEVLTAIEDWAYSRVTRERA